MIKLMEAVAKIIGLHGPKKCPAGACDACEGFHHWIPDCHDGSPDPVGTTEHPAIDAGHITWYGCRHCGAWCEDIEEQNKKEI